MANLDTLLNGYAQGEVDFKTLRDAVRQFRASSAEDAAGVLKALAAARTAGVLDSQTFDALLAPKYVEADDPDATVVLSGPSTGLDDHTSDDSASAGTRSRSPVGTPAAISTPLTTAVTDAGRSDNEDATELRRETLAGSDEPTQVNDSWDEDATEVRAQDDGVTEVSGHGDATPALFEDADRTRVLGADDDRTAVREEDGTASIAFEDADRTRVLGGDDDRTAVRDDGGATSTLFEDADRTRVLGSDDDRTAVNTDATEGSETLDPQSVAAAQTRGADTSVSRTTVVGDDAGGARAGGELGAGDVLKGRFELVSKLGEGGMGAVWKAQDRLQVEARARNPYVAVKLLQGDFKEHPEAFIALQRETSKQQRLAHPNIATVYDFDRDGDTDTVYMTMEVMDGEPLDVFTRKLPAGGLSEEEAMPLIEDICAGLAYAHEAKLVHSDLKPGNAFLVKDEERALGRVKLLDFGIARASKTAGDAEGEATVFDPGQLGALTPSYATVEMFEGQDPDPRDDIYALAIMAYLLFTGKHPYGRKSAPKAVELGLTPEPIAKLDKRQNRGLLHALALAREDRTPSVEVFLNEVRKRKSRTPLYAGGGLVAALLLGTIAYGPVVEEFDRREREAIIEHVAPGEANGIRKTIELSVALPNPEQSRKILVDKRTQNAIFDLLESGEETRLRDALALIRTPGAEELREAIKDDLRTIEALAAFIGRGDEKSIRTGLRLIEPFEVRWQRVVTESGAVKDPIIEYFQREVARAFLPAEGRYDYVGAQAKLTMLEALYPDSADVFQIRGELETVRSAELAARTARFDALLAEAKLLPVDGEDVTDLLDVVRAMDAGNALLTDPRLTARYAELTRAAMQADEYPKAAALLAASAAYTPEDPVLANLRHEVETEIERRANARLAAEIEERLDRRWRGFEVASDFVAVLDDLVRLAELNPRSAPLATITGALQTRLATEIDQLAAARLWADGEAKILTFARLLELPFLVEQRASLAKRSAAAGYQPADTAARRGALAERREGVQALLTEPALTDAWAYQLRALYQELLALLAPDAPELLELRGRIVAQLVAAAIELRDENRFSEAATLVAHGLVFEAQAPVLLRASLSITAAEEALRLRLEEEARQARIAALKGSVLSKAAADEVNDAKAALTLLREMLPMDDGFIATEGPRTIGESYLRLAQRMAERDDFEAATALAPRRAGSRARNGDIAGGEPGLHRAASYPRRGHAASTRTVRAHGDNLGASCASARCARAPARAAGRGFDGTARRRAGR